MGGPGQRSPATARTSNMNRYGFRALSYWLRLGGASGVRAA
jgi:hypothetical protein